MCTHTHTSICKEYFLKEFKYLVTGLFWEEPKYQVEGDLQRIL